MTDISSDKSLNFLFVEILENILRLAESPGECGTYITEQIRELIGVRTVALMRLPSSKCLDYELMSVCPARMRSDAFVSLMQQLAMASNNIQGPQFWSVEVSPPEVKELLVAGGMGTTLVFPLDAGGERVGVLMLLDIMESTGLDTIYASLARLSGVLALVLRNSLLYRDLEAKVAERTDTLLWQSRVDAALAELYAPLISPYATFRDVAVIVLEKAKELTGSEHGYVGIIDQETGVMHLNLTTDKMEGAGHFAVPSGGELLFAPNEVGRYGGLWGYSLNTRKPFYTNDPSVHPAAQGVPRGHIPIHRLLSVPVVLGSSLVAQISLANPPRDYTDRDLDAICRVSEFLALAIQRLRSEEEIRRLNADLEQRVCERTAQLEASNRELESFCYSVSHDLRAPLRHIEGYSALVMEDFAREISDGAGEYLRRIRDATARMDKLIDAMLNLSRLSLEPLRRIPFDLSQLVRKVADDLVLSAPGRSVTFKIADEVRVHADPVLMEVVVNNLLNNALKYTAKKEDALIEFGTLEAGDEPVYFVRDNGAGFDMRYVGKLFGAFQRLHSANEFEGIGIGLATVQRVIHRHGGTIRAEGKPGEGACFFFTLGGAAAAAASGDPA
uniref:histidine kinase n=1 Tax=Geobacter metallireducens TaxID=28232 RepID=A0A831XE03_GEOME